MDNLNPKFIKQFTVEYHFEEKQKFRADLYDVDDFDPKASLDKHDFIGSVQFMLHEVVTSKNQRLRTAIENEKERHRKNGFLTITGEEVSGSSNEMLDLQLTGNFSSKGLLFFIICRSMQNSNQIPIYKSEVQQSIQPQGVKWNNVKMLSSSLCDEDDDRPINIEIYESKKNNNHKNLGRATITLRELRNGKFQIDVYKGQLRQGSL